MILRSLFPYRHPSQCRHSFLFCLLFLMRSAGPTLAENANITCNAFYIRVQPCSHCWLGSVHFLTRTKLHKVLGRQLCDRRHPVYGAACQRYSRNVRMWWTLVGIYRLSIFFLQNLCQHKLHLIHFRMRAQKCHFYNAIWQPGKGSARARPQVLRATREKPLEIKKNRPFKKKLRKIADVACQNAIIHLCIAHISDIPFQYITHSKHVQQQNISYRNMWVVYICNIQCLAVLPNKASTNATERNK